MKQNELYDELIVRCVAGEASEEECNELQERIRVSESLSNHYLVIKNIWDNSVPSDYFDSENLATSYDKVLHRIQKNRSHNKLALAFRIIQRIAAVLFLPLLAFSCYLFFNGKNETSTFSAITQEITSMPGTRIYTVLPDSSEVWINGGSCIEYSQNVNTGHRMISLKGEACFKVVHDKQHPFIVTTSTLEIEATGTEFNVCSYETDSLTTVTLTEGSVIVSDSIVETEMSAGQTIVYNKNLKISRLYLGNTDKNTAWRHGRLVFKNETLANVYKRIGQIYGIEFDVDGKLRDVLFYATFDEASLEQILALIKKSTPLRYENLESRGNLVSRPIVKVKYKP